MTGYIRYKGVVATRNLQIQGRYIFTHDKDKKLNQLKNTTIHKNWAVAFHLFYSSSASSTAI